LLGAGSFGRGGVGVSEQGAEPGRLRLAHKSGRKQIVGDVVVDGSGLQRCPNRLPAEADQLVERHPLGLRSSGEVALTGYLCVAQPGGRLEKRLHLGAVSADESVHGAGSSGRLAQRLHQIRLLPLPSLPQLALGLVASLRELLRRNAVQPIDHLTHAHVLILTEVVQPGGAPGHRTLALRLRLSGYPMLMATRTPLRDEERHYLEPSSGLLHRAEEWVEETGFAPVGEPGEGVPWHAVMLIVAGLALLIALEITLTFGIAKLVTGHAY
jgi:hypothetical protein